MAWWSASKRGIAVAGCAAAAFLARAVTPRREAHAADGGFSVVEVVVASAVLLTASMGVLTSLTFAAVSSGQQAARTQALNLASQRLEQARNLPYDDVGIRYANGAYGDPAGSIPATSAQGPFAITTQVSWTRDPATGQAEYKNIKITVSWTSPQQGSVSVDSAIFGKTALINIGDLSVTVIDKDTNARIPGATVQVTPAGGGSTRLVIADNTGASFFGDLHIGVTAIAVGATSARGETYLFDPIATATVGPDLLTNAVAYGHLPCSIAGSVLDTAGAVVSNAVITLRNPSTGQAWMTTPANGSYSFTQLFPGTYTVSGAKSGYYPSQTYTVTVGSSAPGGRNANQTVTMQPVPPPGTVKVFAKDANGAAVSGVTVHVTGPSPLTTDVVGSPLNTASGTGEADFSQLAAGTYTITGSKAGYTTGSGTAVVAAGGVTTVSLSTPLILGTVKVFVKDSSGTAVPGVTVHVKGPSPSTADVSGSPGNTAAGTGEADFPQLGVGTYTVTGTKTGYASGSGTAVITTGGVTVNLTMPSTAPGSLKVVTGTTRVNVTIKGLTAGASYTNGTTQQTDSNHQYTWSNLAEGQYLVTPAGTSWPTKSWHPSTLTVWVYGGMASQATWTQSSLY